MTTNSPIECEFFDSILCGRYEDVLRVVENAQELLHAFDYRCFGATPITSIAFRGSDSHDLDMIQLLIDLGADVNRRSDWWAGPWSPLHCAICLGNDELAEFLLRNGATIDLHTAAALGKLDELSRLLDADPARISERGGDGCLPLHFAGTVDSARLLLERGADINARCIDHYSTPVQYLSHVRPLVARYLFSKGAECDIFTAVLAGDIDLVKKLILSDSKVIHERIDQNRFPPSKEHDVHNMLTFVVGQNAMAVHAAARGNRPEMVPILHASGADLNCRGGYDDATPLHIAAWNDNFGVGAKLIALGADINIRSGRIHNNSPAGWAIVAGSDRVFSLLMDHNAQIHPWFAEDAQIAIEGGFTKYKPAPAENYANIQNRLQVATRGKKS